jgi:hypothetical protein
VGFIERTVARSPVKEKASAFQAPLREIARAIQGTLNQAAESFAGQAPPPRTDAIDRSIASLETSSPAEGAQEDGASPQHLLFLLRTLREDCAKLCLFLGALARAR